jgi:hypothetical protein
MFEQHFDVHQVVQVGADGDQPGAGGLEALAQVVPQVHELADHLRVDEGHMGARGLLDLVLTIGHHKLAGAQAVELGRVGVERPVEADDRAGLVGVFMTGARRSPWTLPPSRVRN